MQLALTTGLGSRMVMRPIAVTRTRTALIAGFAVACAGLIAVGPSGNPALPSVQHHEVQLVDQFVNPIDPATVFPLALQNIGNLQTAIGNVPLDDKLTDLFTAYGDRLANSFEVSANAFQDLIEQFPTTLQNSLDYLADGEFVAAYSELNSFGLFGLEDVAAPIFDLVSSRRGGEGILNDLAQQTYQALNAVFTRGDLSGFTKALLGPGITANFEAALIADNVEDAINTGDYQGAFNNLLNAPGQILGAYLNGAQFPFVENGETFPGLLNGGPLQFLFVTLPTQISDAITLPDTVAAASAEAIDTGDWSSLLGGDWGALFDAGNWSALFDVSALTESVTSAIDPSAVTDEVTALATSLF